MICGVWKVTDIPENEVGGVVANFELDNPVKVEKSQQPAGKWTVTATFPPCPPGQAGNKVTKHGEG